MSPCHMRRFAFSLSPICWDADAVPELGPDRKVVRPQKIMDYDLGGVTNQQYKVGEIGGH